MTCAATLPMDDPYVLIISCVVVLLLVPLVAEVVFFEWAARMKRPGKRDDPTQ